jgi:formate/nitrite transporter FocA (FNT family)
MNALDTAFDKAEGIAFTTKTHLAATLGAIFGGISAAGTTYWLADKETQEHTGDSISDHIGDAIGSIF